MARQPDPDLRRWWTELISEQPDSGLTIAQFCTANDISTASFYLWRRKLRAEPGKEPNRFLDVQIVDSTTGNDPFRIHLPGGATVEIPATHTDVLREVIGQLQATTKSDTTDLSTTQSETRR